MEINQKKTINKKQKKTKKYYTVGLVPNSNRKILDTQTHDHSLSWLGTGTSIKSDRVKLDLWTEASSFSETAIRIYLI